MLARPDAAKLSGMLPRSLAALLLAPLSPQSPRVGAPLAPVNVVAALVAPSPSAFPPLAFSLTAKAAPIQTAGSFIAAPAALPPAGDADIASGRMFDGTRDLVTHSGSVFTPSRTTRPEVRGGVVYVRAKAAPAAPVKPVPGTDGLDGAALLERVGKIASKGHAPRSLAKASRYLFSMADNHVLNGVRGVAAAYSGLFIPGTSPNGRDYSKTGDKTRDGGPRAQSMNIEHGFPRTYYGKKSPMRSDILILLPDFEHSNERRADLPYGVAKPPFVYQNDAGAKSDGVVFEPPNFTKGRAARLMLYFYARYKNQPFFRTRRVAAFWNRQIEVLLDWNRRFPPTVEERSRNNYAKSFQKNYNPFVDDFGLADRIGAEALRVDLAAERTRIKGVPANKDKKRPERYHRPSLNRRR